MPTIDGTPNNDLMDYRTYSYAQPADWPSQQAWLQLNGLGGNDTILGSIYNDALDGGDGDDILYSYGGNDSIRGGNGIDYLNGGAGNDRLTGEAGNDQLYGENGVDWLDGGAGNDYLDAGAGDDVLVGGAGNDTMFGQLGNDTLFADSGDDILDGGAGSDRLWGNAGDDQYQYNGLGFDYVNDGVTNGGDARLDATYDVEDVLFVNYSDADLGYQQVGDDLWFFSWTDYSTDADIDNAVIIEDYFLGGHHVVEYLYTANGNNTGSIYNLSTIFLA